MHFFLREQERSEAFPDEHKKKSSKGWVEKIKKSFLFYINVCVHIGVCNIYVYSILQ